MRHDCARGKPAAYSGYAWTGLLQPRFSYSAGCWVGTDPLCMLGEPANLVPRGRSCMRIALSHWNHGADAHPTRLYRSHAGVWPKGWR